MEQRRKLNIATFVRTIFHPAYAAVERTHDVAVLELAEDMNATNIPFLYGRPAFNATKMSIQGYGWAQDLDGNGRLRNAVHDGRLRQVTVDVISEADCIARHGAEYNSTCAYTHCICAGGPYKGALKVCGAHRFWTFWLLLCAYRLSTCCALIKNNQHTFETGRQRRCSLCNAQRTALPTGADKKWQQKSFKAC